MFYNNPLHELETGGTSLQDHGTTSTQKGTGRSLEKKE